MLSFLIALRNAVIIVLLSWLGLEAPGDDERRKAPDETAKMVVGVFR